MNRRDCLKICAAFLGGAAIVPFSFAQPRPGAVRLQLRFVASLANPVNDELRDQVVWLYMPVGETPTQKLEGLKVSADYELLSDALGHSIVKLVFQRFAPLASKVVNIAADVTLDGEQASTALTNPRNWLGAERYVETGDRRIQALAAELACPTQRGTARAIYDWVRGHLEYAGYVADDMGALDALIRRRGDCTEYAYLAVALARANGIPARMVGGYVAERSIAPRAEEYHNWAEVYVDGAWRLLDAQKGHWLVPAEQYVAFRYYREDLANPLEGAHRFRVAGAVQVKF